MRALFLTTQAKLFAVIVVVTAALAGFLPLYFSSAHIDAVNRELERKALTYARFASTEAEPAIAFNDVETARELFNAIAFDQDVRALALYKSNGELLYTFGEFEGTAVPPYSPVSVTEVRRTSHYVRSVVPVAAKEGARGTLVIELTTDGVEVEAVRIRYIAVAVGFLAFLFGMMAAWAIGRSLSRRLRAVARVAHSIACGELDVELTPDDSRDEVGQLSRSFEVMVSSTRTLVDHIRGSAESEKERLDELVRERTSELEASVGRYRSLVETTNAIPWEMDAKTLVCTYLAPQAALVVGQAPQALLNTLGLWDFVHPADVERVRAQLTVLAASETAQRLDIDFAVLAPDGHSVELRSFVANHGFEKGQHPTLRGISLDVTHQKRLELELRQAQKLESVGRLAAGVAHEINTPVQFVGDSIQFVRDAMRDMAELIVEYRAVQQSVIEGAPSLEAAERAKSAEDDADIEYVLENVPKALDRAAEGLERVANIVRTMKELSHPEQKEKTPFDINRAIRATLTVAASEYKYVADVETDLGDLPLVPCHGGQINQAILNILVNAAHAIGDKNPGSGDRGTIAIKTWREGDSAVISISDTGGGIPEAVRDRIFDPFFTTKDIGRGTGQGLAISRSVIREKHRGELTFETEMGKGTTFFIRLPIEPATSPTALAA